MGKVKRALHRLGRRQDGKGHDQYDCAGLTSLGMAEELFYVHFAQSFQALITLASLTLAFDVGSNRRVAMEIFK